MKDLLHHGWVLLLLILLVAGCAPEQEIEPTAVPSTVLIHITPAARPAHAAVRACAASLPGFLFETEERFASEASSDLVIRLGVPEIHPGFLAQIASDELAVVLHPENPSASLTTAEIQALFSGQVTNWAEYNGSDAPVQVWVPLPVDETRMAFDSQILQGLPVVSDARLAPDPQSMQQALSADPDAIGYLPVSWQPSDLHSILLGIRLPLLVSASQVPEGPAAELTACLQGEIGQQALQQSYP